MTEEPQDTMEGGQGPPPQPVDEIEDPARLFEIVYGTGDYDLRDSFKALERLKSMESIDEEGSEHPSELLLGDVKKLPYIFQSRGGGFVYGENDQRHIEDLHRSLRSEKSLDPVTVWPCYGVYVLIDGHHRFEAYEREERTTIPIHVFEGSFKDAIYDAARANTKSKLPILTQQKMDYAWRLVACGVPKLTKKEVEEASGASDGSIASMRRAKRAMTKEGEDPLLYGCWMQARRWHVKFQKPCSDFPSDEEIIEEQARMLADRMAPVLRGKSGSSASCDERVLSRTFQIVTGRQFVPVLVSGAELEGLTLIDGDGNPVLVDEEDCDDEDGDF